jgi:hypothetical protein
MHKQFKTNELPVGFKKLQKPGYYIYDNQTKNVHILPAGGMAVFKTKEEAKSYVVENNIDGIIK